MPKRTDYNIPALSLANTGGSVLQSQRSTEESYRLNLIEIAIRPTLEDKVNSLQERIFRPDILLNDKFYAFLQLLTFYRFINRRFFNSAYEAFRSLVPSSSKNQAIQDLKRDNYPEVTLLITYHYDCNFPNFPTVL